MATEILILMAVCLIPQQYNAIANALISFACGMQVEAFRNLDGNPIVTTMCIGNLRSGTCYLDKFIQTKDKMCIKKASLYFAVILFFVIGAVVESILIGTFGEKALFLSVLLLGIAFILMLIRPTVEESDCNDFVGD